MSVDSQSNPLRLAIGPSPWAFGNRSLVVCGTSYQFRETVPGDSKLAGLTSIQDVHGDTLLILDFYNYLRILDDGHVLLWRESRDKQNHRIVFDSFSLSSLQTVGDVQALAAQIRQQNLGVGPLLSREHWELPCRLDVGDHQISMPYNWSSFEETLVLADYSELTNGKRAIFVFDWSNRRVQIFPQDWFNQGDYDFGYQWITRVWRRRDGSIAGDGIRLGKFVLDITNRQVKTWLVSDPFYMIQ